MADDAIPGRDAAPGNDAAPAADNQAWQDRLASNGPLRVAALIKQVPLAEAMEMGLDGRLIREGAPLELNPYCRRAVSKGAEIAKLSGGRSVAVTLGPPSAEDVLREALAWGIDEGLHLCDPAFAGADTLATAQALSAALRRYGPFDLVLVGRNTIDGETGQVGPEIAQFLDVPFACGVRHLRLEGRLVRAVLELDDGFETVELQLPAVLSVAERLCEPAKVDPDGRAAVSAARVDTVLAAALGDGPWGDAASPTRVGAVRHIGHQRHCKMLEGDPAAQVRALLGLLDDREIFDPPSTPVAQPAQRAPTSSTRLVTPRHGEPVGGPLCVVVEPGRLEAARELLGAAQELAIEGQAVVAYGPMDRQVGQQTPEVLGRAGADAVWAVTGAKTADAVAKAFIRWTAKYHPWAVLAPSTAFGREVAGRVAATLGAGLVGDAVGLERLGDDLVAAKPALAGALVADISFRSPVQLVTVRPGILPLRSTTVIKTPAVTWESVEERGRVRVLSAERDDDVEILARAAMVIGVGTGVRPEEYELLEPLAQLLGAELAASRKVTDQGWMPRARQVGITGRSISPRMYLAIGLSGKFNHMVGVRGAGTVVAVNQDPDALVFGQADVGVCGDWRVIVPELEAQLRERQPVEA